MRPKTLATLEVIWDLLKTLPLDELAEARAWLRQRALANGLLAGFLGFRISRKKRAVVRRVMREATGPEFIEALGLVRSGIAVHLVEQRFTKRRIKITRNALSQAMGARP